ncbi:MAG TPA: hypothetical protein VMX13_06960 [Sedimentisphaerales bacterium]|nr:hypothetical protein [Sedimentisphaerales bacterium]
MNTLMAYFHFEYRLLVVSLALGIVVGAFQQSAARASGAELNQEDVQNVRSFFDAMSQSLTGFYLEYEIDVHPLDEKHYPTGNIESTITNIDGNPQVVQMWLQGLRQSHSRDSTLDVFGSRFLHKELTYHTNARKFLKDEALSSFDGTQNYAYWPDEEAGTIATDEAGREIPENPITTYKNAASILGDVGRFELLSYKSAVEETGGDAPDGPHWIFELWDTKEGALYRIHRILVDASKLQILRHRVYGGDPSEPTIQEQVQFRAFANRDLGYASLDLPETITKENMFVNGSGRENDPMVFAKRTVFRINKVEPPKLTEDASFAVDFREGTKVWVKDLGYSYFAGGDKQTTLPDPQYLYDVLDADTTLSAQKGLGKATENDANDTLPSKVPGEPMGGDSNDTARLVETVIDDMAANNAATRRGLWGALLKMGVPLVIFITLAIIVPRLIPRERR